MNEHIYLVVKVGPDWTIPLEAWTDHPKAVQRAAILDRQLDSKNAIDRLSVHAVYPIKLDPEGV